MLKNNMVTSGHQLKMRMEHGTSQLLLRKLLLKPLPLEIRKTIQSAVVLVALKLQMLGQVILWIIQFQTLEWIMTLNLAKLTKRMLKHLLVTNGIQNKIKMDNGLYQQL